MTHLFSLLLQDGPAETTGYMIFGYAVIFGTMFLYLVSLFLRWKNFQKDQEALEDLEKKS